MYSNNHKSLKHFFKFFAFIKTLLLNTLNMTYVAKLIWYFFTFIGIIGLSEMVVLLFLMHRFFIILPHLICTLVIVAEKSYSDKIMLVLKYKKNYFFLVMCDQNCVFKMYINLGGIYVNLESPVATNKVFLYLRLCDFMCFQCGFFLIF